MAAFTADYMEVIKWLSVAGGVRSEPMKLPEPESLEWRVEGPRRETPTFRGRIHSVFNSTRMEGFVSVIERVVLRIDLNCRISGCCYIKKQYLMFSSLGL